MENTHLNWNWCICPRANTVHIPECPPPPPTPIWMTENEFRSHFSPFQINTQLFISFSQNGCWRPFWMTENHRSLFSPFQINTQLFILFTKCLPATILHDRKSLSIAFLTISDQYATFVLICLQNGCRPPFWVAENHFRSHFSPFQINPQLFFFSQNGCRRPFEMTENHF